MGKENDHIAVSNPSITDAQYVSTMAGDKLVTRGERPDENELGLITARTIELVKRTPDARLLALSITMSDQPVYGALVIEVPWR